MIDAPQQDRRVAADRGIEATIGDPSASAWQEYPGLSTPGWSRDHTNNLFL
jgi:hypothetical protein